MDMFVKKTKFYVVGVGALLAILSYVIFVFSYGPSASSLQGINVNQKSLQSMLQEIADTANQAGVPGVILTIKKNDKWYEAAAGSPSKVSSEKMPLDEPLRIGSISKVYTAVVIIKLQQAGLLDLNLPIDNYLPQDIANQIANADSTSVKQVLMHTSGIPDYYTLYSYFMQDWTRQITMKRMLPEVSGSPATNPPGQGYTYSNMGYVLLGEIAQNVTGKPLNLLIEEFIFQPLVLDRTFYNIKHSPNQKIHGYGTEFRPWADTYELWEHSGPDAGILATAKNVILFLDALTNETGLLSETGKIMLSDTVKISKNQQQSLGFHNLLSKSGDRLIGHTGNVFGYQTIAYKSETHGFTLFAHLTCDCTEVTSGLIKVLYQVALNGD
jgi:D-alanyl-D-alanine carboxypeptidase